MFFASSLFLLSLCASPVLAASRASGEDRPTIEDLIRRTKEWAEQDRALVESRVKEILVALELPYEKSGGQVPEKIDELVKLGPRSLAWILPCLNPTGKDDREVQRGRNAARAVGRIGSTQAIAPCLALLESGTDFGRENAVHVLGALRATQAEKPLWAFLSTQTPPDTRQKTIWALGQIRGESSVEPLTHFLKEADQANARAILEALEAIRSPKAIAPVAALLPEPYFRPMLGRFLAFLQAMGGQEALPHLLKAVALPEWGTSQLAQIVQTIGKLGAPNYPAAIPVLKPMLASAEKDLRDEVAYTLNDLGDDSGVKQLIAPHDDYLKDYPRDAQGYAVRGKIWLRLRRYKEALRDFKDAVRVARKDMPVAEFHVFQARCYAGMNQLKEAHSALKTSELDATQLARYKDFPEFKALREHEKYGLIFK